MIDKILEERGARYGDFKDNARISQGLKKVLRTGAKWNQLSYIQKESLEIIAHKMARIINGDPNYIDNWVDMIGYTQLAKDSINDISRLADARVT